MKKILVLYTPRSGSTNFTNSLAKYYEVKNVMYPIKQHYTYNIISEKIEFLKNQNGFIIKQNTLQKYDKLNFLIKSINFDNIILLSRYNIDDAINSFSYMENNANSFNSWSTKYQYDNLNIDISIKYSMEYAYNMIKKISEELTIPIYYYEDLYINNSKKTLIDMNFNLDISVFMNILNNKQKQRIIKNNNLYLI